ncbi:DUF2214 family protein [Bordetella avium]|uniref:Membrane protein n=1 Tax=Bordetella avium (strain 197N) TaxID=360910 RepID=Q2L2D8_BORA1|nr:DUF2214 family protein [Bordetella avium]AZY48684.1 DUF2214 domain-containing protein [Bordetella avium]AZY52065.1 DUF2214 domain-containing protein [Bordetella avium]RIQ16933.1 DUF2214 family protein [Bordetella avium]RIQ36341.1 DUF2214 family protein [Bordetella avium]RIQ54630.1 DUF2214 family protein [Bordetella avium]
MLQDALLAWLHYVAIFLVVVLLTAESVLLRPSLNSETIARLIRYDRFYLLAALLALVTGVLRFAFGAKGGLFYMINPWFHAKITLFVIIGLCSIKPTLHYLRWRDNATGHDGTPPSPEQVKSVRRWVMIEAHLLILMLLFATLMAGGVSF